MLQSHCERLQGELAAAAAQLLAAKRDAEGLREELAQQALEWAQRLDARQRCVVCGLSRDCAGRTASLHLRS